MQRDIDIEDVRKALEGKPKERFEVQYFGADPDSYRLGIRIWQALGNAGWEVNGFGLTELPQSKIDARVPPAGALSGVRVVLHTLLPMSLWEHPFATLSEAFKPLRIIISGNPDVPEGVVRIVVGPKEPMEPEQEVIRIKPLPRQ